jgi:hypothetical protein
MSFLLSEWNNSAPSGRFFMKFDIRVFFVKKSVKKIEDSPNLIRITGILHKDQYSFLTITNSFLLRIENISDKYCKENQNTYLILRNIFFFENCAVYKTMFKNILQPDRSQMTIWRITFTCCLTNATKHTHRIINKYFFSALNIG